jgi:hypothetical protein
MVVILTCNSRSPTFEMMPTQRKKIILITTALLIVAIVLAITLPLTLIKKSSSNDEAGDQPDDLEYLDIVVQSSNTKETWYALDVYLSDTLQG